MNNKKALRNEVATLYVKLGEVEAGTPEYKAIAESIALLQDREIELKKANDEFVNNLAKNALTAVTTAATIAAGLWVTVVSYNFESAGVTPTTSMGRSWLNKMIPKN